MTYLHNLKQKQKKLKWLLNKWDLSYQEEYNQKKKEWLEKGSNQIQNINNIFNKLQIIIIKKALTIEAAAGKFSYNCSPTTRLVI